MGALSEIVIKEKQKSEYSIVDFSFTFLWIKFDALSQSKVDHASH